MKDNYVQLRVILEKPKQHKPQPLICHRNKVVIDPGVCQEQSCLVPAAHRGSVHLPSPQKHSGYEEGHCVGGRVAWGLREAK